MKNIKDIINNCSSLQDQDYTQRIDPEIDPAEKATTNIVNLLFKELHIIFPSFIPDDLASTKKSWIKAFMAAGINRVEELRRGLKKCRLLNSSFAPTSGQFIYLCKPEPEDIGLPDKNEAYKISLRLLIPTAVGYPIYKYPDEKIHSVIMHAINDIGSYDYRMMTAKEGKKAFFDAYERSLQKFTKNEIKIIPYVTEIKQIEYR